VVVESTGHVVVRDLETGRVTVTGQLAESASPTWTPVFQVAGGLLLADGSSGGRRMVSAYGLDALDLRWRAELNVSTEFISADCGGALCVFARSGGLRVIDPDTGQTRWADPRWVIAETISGRLLAHAWQLPGPDSWSAVIDPQTGSALLDLGLWTTLHTVRPGRDLTAVRVDSRSGRAWFGVVDLTDLTVRVLGSALDVSGDCRAGSGWFVCRRLNASIGVWTYRAPADR
jgi:hypothetical protein